MTVATGIHIYAHTKAGKIISKIAYNHRHGMQQIRLNSYLKDYDICAVGWHGFSLVVHYRRKY